VFVAGHKTGSHSALRPPTEKPKPPPDSLRRTGSFGTTQAPFCPRLHGLNSKRTQNDADDPHVFVYYDATRNGRGLIFASPDPQGPGGSNDMKKC